MSNDTFDTAPLVKKKIGRPTGSKSKPRVDPKDKLREELVLFLAFYKEVFPKMPTEKVLGLYFETAALFK